MPTVRRSLLVGLIVVASARAGHAQDPNAAPTPPQSRYQPSGDHGRPLTRAERTGFAETSHYDDVIAFIDSLKALHADIATGTIGKTSEGRDIPYVIASRPLVTSPAGARRLNRPIVYVQANIHAGEVEGKEAMQALLRDLLFSKTKNVLDSIVLIAVPIYNADGNERFGDQGRNRGEQNGPPLVGQRPNGKGLDLNRDYVKAEAPETRGSLAMFNAWDPDVFMDLHTTDGSYHGYALTYSPSLNPASLFAAPWTHDTLLATVRQRMRQRHGFEVFDYGNFTTRGAEISLFSGNAQDTVGLAWRTYEHFPRYGTNYYGLRGRVSVLSEAFSHDPFPRRVASTYDFVSEVLSYVGEQSKKVLSLTRGADKQVAAWAAKPGTSAPIAIRSQMTTHPSTQAVLVEQLEATSDTARTAPGVRRGARRTGRIVPVTMGVLDRFEQTLTTRLPFAYAIDAQYADSVLPRLLLHGIAVQKLDAPVKAMVEAFAVDSAVRAARGQFATTTVSGQWAPAAARTLPRGAYVVRAGQPLGIVAAYLLEPESDDGLAAWHFLDSFLAPGKEFPIVRIAQPIAAGSLQPLPN
jgi:Zinc carboxypeptidase